MTSTLGDLSLLAIALSDAGDPLIKTALSLTAPVGPRSRFVPGFAVMDRSAGPRIWRAGGVEGFTADIEAEPGTGSAVVILTTRSPPEPFDDLATEMLQIARDG